MEHLSTPSRNAMDPRHDFDFFFGSWRQANRKRVRPLVQGDGEWVEFESWTEARPILGGLGNIDTFTAPDLPGRPNFEGFSLRLVEPETGLWRIWWASTIGNGQLDPPVVGRFEDGVGVFECDDEIEGVPVKVRFTWKDITADSATCEQSFPSTTAPPGTRTGSPATPEPRTTRSVDTRAPVASAGAVGRHS